MSVLDFNFDDWAAKGGYSSHDESLKKSDNNPTSVQQNVGCNSGTKAEEVEKLVDAICQKQIDLTQGYDRWRDIGFALSSEFGVVGRDWYHRISQYHPNYTESECDKQYSRCVNSRGSGITINTLFHYAKEAGINIKPANTYSLPHTPQSAVSVPKTTNNINSLIINNIDNINEKDKQTAKCGECGIMAFSAPTFSDKIDVDLLPDMLHPIYNMYDEPSSRDMMLIGALTVMGPLLPNYFTYYMNSVKYISNYTIITAPFAGGKGEVALIRYILMPLEDREKNKFNNEKANWEEKHSEWERMGNNSANRSKRGPEPKMPIESSPVCSGDITEAALCQEINNNGGRIVMMGTELDDCVTMMKNRYGDYSKLLRAGWQNETYTSTRKMDNLHICIRSPKIGFLYAGTADQLKSFLPSAQNGLASRISNYTLKPDYEFHNPFITSEQPKEETFKAVGAEYLNLMEQMEILETPVQFILSQHQAERMFSFFSDEHTRGRMEIGNNYMGFVKRQGLNATRIAMTLAILRRYSQKKAERQALFSPGEQALIATDRDVELALIIQQTLNEHTQMIYESMQWNENASDTSAKLRSDESRLYDALPNRFSTQQAKEIAEAMGIKPRSIERWLPKYIRCQMTMAISKGVYAKCKT